MSRIPERKRRSPPETSPQHSLASSTNRDHDKRQKLNPSADLLRQFSPKEGPSSSKSATVASTSRQPDSERPFPYPPARPTSHSSSHAPPAGNQRLTKALFDQIPFLESDPLKALEILKKMVQESGLETLYTNVNENTSRARDFSDRIAALKKDVNDIVNFMLSGKPSEQEKLEKYKQMKAIWSKIHGLNEAKVKLTQSAYDMVDRVIRRLDKELESINNEIGTEKNVGREKGPSKKNSSYRPYTGAMGASFEGGPNRSRMRGADFDMPVDPNEPTYCECKQISYGEMIACDNVSCPIEWFHFSCVGLSSKPKGKWFCKRCVASGQNKLNKKKKSRPGIIEKYASASDKSEVEQILSADDSD